MTTEEKLERIEQATSSILVCLKGSDLTGPGLMQEVSSLKKKMQALENRNMKMVGGLIVIGFLLEQGIRFVFPGTIK